MMTRGSTGFSVYACQGQSIKLKHGLGKTAQSDSASLP